jgi:hypothetical protein
MCPRTIYPLRHNDVHSTPALAEIFFTLNRRLLGFVKSDPELDLLAKLSEAEPRVLLKPVSWWSIQPATWTLSQWCLYCVLLTFALFYQHREIILAATHFWIFYSAKYMYLLVLFIILLQGRYDSHNTLQRQYTENSKQIFPEMKLRGLNPNSCIHASVSDLYIPTIAQKHDVAIRTAAVQFIFWVVHKSDFLCSVCMF